MKKILILLLFSILTLSTYANDSSLERALNEEDDAKKYKILHVLLDIYEEKYEINQNNPETLMALGKIYTNIDQYGEAKSYLMHLYNLYPENPTSHVALGDFYYYFGEYNTALEFYKLALSSGYLRDIDTNFKTAIVYEKLGDVENANLYYDICLYLKPDFDKAKNRKLLLSAQNSEIKNFELNENELSETDDSDEEINKIINTISTQKVEETFSKKPKRTNKHYFNFRKKNQETTEEEISE